MQHARFGPRPFAPSWWRGGTAALPALLLFLMLLGATPVLSLVASVPIAALGLRRRCWDHGISAGALLIFGGALLSVPFSIDPHVTLQAIAGMVGAAACTTLLVRWWPRERRLVGGLLGFCAIACLIVLVATIQVDIAFAKLNAWSEVIYAWFRLWPRLDNVGFSQNATAALVVAACPFAVALACSQRSLLLRLSAAVASCWLLFALVLTLSRGAYLGLSLAFAAMLWLLGGKARFLAPLPPLLTLALLLLGITGYEFTLSATPTGWSSADRLYIWRTALRLLADFPLTGPGSGTFPQRVPAYTWPMEARDIPHAHNFLLQTYLDSGLLGVAGLLLLLLGFANGVRRVLAARLSPTLRALTIGSAGALTGTLAHGSVDAYFWGDPRTFFVVAMPIAVLLTVADMGGVSLAFPSLPPVPAIWPPWGSGLSRPWARSGRLVSLAVVLGLGALLGRPLLSLALTNSGNLARERAELLPAGATFQPLALAAAQLQLRLASSLYPGDGVAWQDLAEVYIDQGNTPEAAASLEIASADGQADALMARDDRRLSQLAIAQASPSQRSLH